MGHLLRHAALWISAGLVSAVSLTALRANDEDPQATEALWLADHANLVHKVKTLVIGDVDLKDVTMDQALDFLRRQSKLSASGHQGINFVFLNESAVPVPRKFSLKLKNATIENVVDHLPAVRSSIGDFVVSLQPTGGLDGEGIPFRTFTVPDNYLAINSSMLTDKNKQIYNVRSLFEAQGIRFPPGARAVYAIPQKT